MNALAIAVSSPQPTPAQALDYSGEASPEELFAARVARVNGLVDEKTGLVMESARLCALVSPTLEQRERCLALVQEIDAKIARLQEQIDRELKGLFYGLQKAPAPSPFTDDLPG